MNIRINKSGIKVIKIIFRIPFTVFFIIKYKFENDKRYFYTVGKKEFDRNGYY